MPIQAIRKDLSRLGAAQDGSRSDEGV